MIWPKPGREWWVPGSRALRRTCWGASSTNLRFVPLSPQHPSSPSVSKAPANARELGTHHSRPPALGKPIIILLRSSSLNPFPNPDRKRDIFIRQSQKVSGECAYPPRAVPQRYAPLGIISNNFAARMFEHGGYAHSPDTALIPRFRLLKLKLCERLKAFSANLCD